jgi:hypothetical protein
MSIRNDSLHALGSIPGTDRRLVGCRAEFVIVSKIAEYLVNGVISALMSASRN